MKQSQTPNRDPWDPYYVQPYYLDTFGKDLGDPEKRAIWCKACFYAGNTLRLWNQAVELKIAFLAACSVQEGQKVALLGKYISESGLAPALQSLLGKSQLEVVDISASALTNISQTPSKLQWDFHYFDTMPEESLDKVILFGAASHIGNWKDCARQIHRVLKDNGRLIIAEAPLGGKDFVTAVHQEVGHEVQVSRILAGMGIKEEDLPGTGAEELAELFNPFLRWSRSHSWQGLYLFYGQKGGSKGGLSFELPISTEAVQTFLTEKPFATSWDFMTTPELAAFGTVIGDTAKQWNWGRGTFLAGSLRLLADRNKMIIDLMYDNLKAKPGDKVLMIGELFEELGILTQLHQRKGEMGEIAKFDIAEKSRSYFGKGAVPLWDYDYADSYPDKYFDVVWIAQGLHHVASWPDLAPKLLRVLKPGGQVMLQECRSRSPEFFTGVNMSGLLRCIAEKIYFGPGRAKLTDGVFDVPSKNLNIAFGDSLTDIFTLEWKGWIVFYGFKI